MIRSCILIPAFALTACIAADVDDATGDELGTVEQDSTSTNGISINGISINGISINGISINGISINGVSVTGVTATAGQLKGTKSGTLLQGTGMVGAKLTGTLATGGTIQLRVDAAQVLLADAWAYKVSTSTNGTTWTPMCSNADNLAAVIDGRWDYRSGVAGAGGWIADSASFTFGCRGTAIAKCIELGYRPWATVGGVVLRNHHTACVRMIRGDYCGDGHAYTQDGNTINVYDGLGIQTDAKTWSFDASWKATGAACARKTRTLNGTPACFTTLVGCSTVTFSSTVLIADEYF